MTFVIKADAIYKTNGVKNERMLVLMKLKYRSSHPHLTPLLVKEIKLFDRLVAYKQTIINSNDSNQGIININRNGNFCKGT